MTTNSITLISIIVPCYNQAQYLDECLQSVLDQTFQNWECIIVNDGSPDNTEDVALNWTKKDPRFIYLKKENGGLSSARNAGIASAKGEWILPLDCDDKIGKDYLTLAQKAFDKNFKIIYCKAKFFGDQNAHWELPSYGFNELLIHNIIFCSALFKKMDWLSVNGYDEKLIYGREDWDFWLSLLKPNDKVYCLDYLGFYYRIKAESMDKTINRDLEKKNFSENYILQKHYKKYGLSSNNMLELFRNHDSMSAKLEQTTNEIAYYKTTLYKNKISRLLYKLIKSL